VRPVEGLPKPIHLLTSLLIGSSALLWNASEVCWFRREIATGA
jgi:hypothetical protein